MSIDLHKSPWLRYFWVDWNRTNWVPRLVYLGQASGSISQVVSLIKHYRVRHISVVDSTMWGMIANLSWFTTTIPNSIIFAQHNIYLGVWLQKRKIIISLSVKILDIWLDSEKIDLIQYWIWMNSLKLWNRSKLQQQYWFLLSNQREPLDALLNVLDYHPFSFKEPQRRVLFISSLPCFCCNAILCTED